MEFELKNISIFNKVPNPSFPLDSQSIRFISMNSK